MCQGGDFTAGNGAGFLDFQRAFSSYGDTYQQVPAVNLSMERSLKTRLFP